MCKGRLASRGFLAGLVFRTNHVKVKWLSTLLVQVVILKALQIATIAVLSLVAVVVVGVQQGKQPRSGKPVETKGALERLEHEHLEDAVPLRQ